MKHLDKGNIQTMGSAEYFILIMMRIYPLMTWHSLASFHHSSIFANIAQPNNNKF